MAVIAAGIQKANTFDASQVEQALHQIDMTTLVGHVSFDNSGDLKEQHVYVFQVKDGGFVQVYPK